jgi:curved DNA-binding protein CbpA
MNYYEILGIDSGASTDEIERAFRAAARRVHPDLSPGDKARAEERMKQLNEIRDTLTDPLLRVGYDERLRREAPRPAAPRPAARGPATPSGAPADRAAPGDGGARATRPAKGRGGPLALAALGLALVASAVAVSIPSVHRASWGEGPTPAAPSAPPNPTSGSLSTSGSPSTATPAGPPAPRPPRGPRRRGVVRIGSSVEDVVRAFGAADSIEAGAHAGDATFHYGKLRLEIENGRVTGGDAAGR